MRTLTILALVLGLLAAAQPACATGLLDSSAIKNFYDQRQAQFYWQDAGGPTAAAQHFATLLGDSWKQGLNPATYHTDKIAALMDATDPDSTARLEILLTDAFVRYTRDMSGMRVNPEDFDMDAEDWRQRMSAEEALKILVENPDIQKFLDDLTPKSQTYSALQKALVDALQEPTEPYLKVLPIGFDGRMINPGDRHKRIPDLRLRLGVRQQTDDPYFYDDRLAGAVMKFQQHSGLTPDGMVGPTTLKLLNHSNRDKMLQIVANLERLRWVDESRPDRFVMVNIPAATLWAVEDQKVAFQMPVVVGRPQRPTQSFIADITGVRFNPDWTVPPTIKREDILPRLRKDPNYLNDKGMALIWNTSEGPVMLDPLKIDWNDITAKNLSEVEMVQTPGAHNPLGTIRILMPNRYNIYLHDTNEREYFDKRQRAQSSGCIRMKEPQKMAGFVMDGVKDWSDNKMKTLIADGKTHDVKIPATIPVYILYYSAWADEQGRVIFGNDIYDLDKKVIAKLAGIDGFALPGHNEGVPAGPVRPQ